MLSHQEEYHLRGCSIQTPNISNPINQRNRWSRHRLDGALRSLEMKGNPAHASGHGGMTLCSWLQGISLQVDAPALG